MRFANDKQPVGKINNTSDLVEWTRLDNFSLVRFSVDDSEQSRIQGMDATVCVTGV